MANQMFTLGEVVDMCIAGGMSVVVLSDDGDDNNIGDLCCSRGLFSSGGVSVSECGIGVIRSRSLNSLLSSLHSFNMNGNFMGVLRSRGVNKRGRVMCVVSDLAGLKVLGDVIMIKSVSR